MSDEEQDQELDQDQDQEQKLTRRERRAQAKGGSAAADVRDRNERLRADAAARRRKLRSEERTSKGSEGLAASERVDDALVRSADVAGKFVRSNFAWLQWMILLGAGLAIFALVWRYRSNLQREKHGHVLASVLGVEFGKLDSQEAAEQRDPRLVDTRPAFADAEARSKKALSAWDEIQPSQAAEVKYAARLGEAHAHYDLKQYDEAKKGYEALVADKGSKLYPHIEARALEGIGFCLEAKQQYTEALEAFKKLQTLDPKEERQLGQFHQARVLLLLGRDDEAKKMLSELNTALSKNADVEGPSDYLGAAVRDLLRRVDPQFAIVERQELEKKQAEEQAKRLQEMIEQMKKKNGNFQLPEGLEMPAAELPATPDAPEPTQPHTEPSMEPPAKTQPPAPAQPPAEAPSESAPTPSPEP